MKKLTSKNTFICKRLFPIFWFGFLALFMVVSFLGNGKEKGPVIVFIAFPIIMALIGYILMKNMVFDLADEVYDEGESLLFKNRGKEVRVYLKDIKNVSYTTIINPPRVTLSIRHTTELGDELTFSPPAGWIPFRKNRDIEALIDRVDRARGYIIEKKNEQFLNLDKASISGIRHFLQSC
jgi:hypothetical protein